MRARPAPREPICRTASDPRPPRRRAAAPTTGLALALAGVLGACGFEPLYDPAGPAAAVAGRVEVEVIPGTPGYLMRERLIERLGPAAAPTHRLAVDLGLTQVGVAITEDDITSRFDVTGVAAWTLTTAGAETPALAEEARATTGYSAPTSATTSAYAILSAREDAERRVAVLLADRIAQRIAVTAPDWSAGSAPDPAPAFAPDPAPDTAPGPAPGSAPGPAPDTAPGSAPGSAAGPSR